MTTETPDTRMQATQRPWYHFPQPDRECFAILERGTGNPIIAEVFWPDGSLHGEGAANAELIVRAVNNFDDLLTACKQLLNAPHQEHFIVRLNDEEMEGLDAIKSIVERVDGELP